MSEVAKSCAQLVASEGFGGSTNQTDLDILNETLELDLRLEGWTADLPPEWSHVTSQLVSHGKRPIWSTKLLAGPGGPEQIWSYTNRLAVSKWNICRASRIRLNLALLEFLHEKPSLKLEYSGLESRTLDLLLTLTTEIAYSVPYLLSFSHDGSTDYASASEVPTLWGYMSLWPLHTSFLCLSHGLVKGSDSQSRGLWFRGMLDFLRDSLGIAKVEALINDVIDKQTSVCV